MAKKEDKEEPDFSEFWDWDRKNPKVGHSQTPPHRKPDETVVNKNIKLLLNGDDWSKRVKSFEGELAKIKDEYERKKKREQFFIRFDGYKFEKGKEWAYYSFCNFVFPCEVSFNRVKFVNCDINFEKAKFTHGKVDFQCTNFGNGNIEFKEVKFLGGDVNFSHAISENSGIGFEKAEFFGGNVDFRGVKFLNGHVNFSEAIFDNGNVWFSNAEFSGFDVTFNKAKFRNGFVNFQNIICNTNMSFNEVNFCSCSIIFEDATFGKGHVWFTGAIFKSDYISFSRAKFKGEFRFTPDKEKTEIQSASFNDVEVGGNLTIDADFNKEATFQRLDVKGSADFSGSTFKKVPDFRDMKLDRPPEVAGMKVPRPKLKTGLWTQKIYADDKDQNKVDVAKYRKLKSMAVAASDHEKSGEFFAYEMMAKRGVETNGFFPLFFNYLYGLLSDYGQSYLRPLLALGINWFIFACLNIWKIFQELVFKGELDFWQNIGLSFLLSLRNLIPFFNSLSRFAPTPKDHVSGFQKSMNRLGTEGVNIDLLTTIGIIEQLIGAILLFLLLLGLRNAFRLK